MKFYLPFASYQAQPWRYDQPWRKMEKPCVKRGRATDKGGNPLADVSPPEYFSDMAINHWLEFNQFLLDMLDAIELGVITWRFLDVLPSLDEVGQPLPGERFRQDFQSDYAQFFKTFRNIHDGELLELEGAWMDTEDIWPAFNKDKIWQQAALWHVQYATNQTQQDKMHNHMCVGSRPGVGSSQRVVDGRARFPIQTCLHIGMDVTVHRINGQLGTHDLRSATVVTWPQLFIMGAHAQLTALEVYTVGLMCRRIMARRAKSKGGAESRDKYRAKHAKSWESTAAVGANHWQAANGTNQAVSPGGWWQTSGWQDAEAQWWQTTTTAHGGGAWADWPSRAKDRPNATHGWGSHPQQ